ncbi:MAG: HAMP domain-containing histidine kinase, partial [Armatimonadetes bacterium]|nr:HAMP domain-containing histidine kinase [Armatimonadota bacterium]
MDTAIHSQGPDTPLSADERLRLVAQSASGVLHDIKNAMTVIRGNAELVELTAPAARRYSDNILDQVDLLTGMLLDLLSFARGRAGSALQEVDVAELMGEVAASELPSLERAGIELFLETDDAGVARLDPVSVRRAVANLMSNARDAMPDGGTLALRAAAVDGSLMIEVSDTGCGMSAEVRERLFEPFFSHGKPQGTGLGMFIVQELVAAHRGRVEVRSSEGQGTAVALYFPLEVLSSPAACAAVTRRPRLGRVPLPRRLGARARRLAQSRAWPSVPARGSARSRDGPAARRRPPQ